MFNERVSISTCSIYPLQVKDILLGRLFLCNILSLRFFSLKKTSHILRTHDFYFIFNKSQTIYLKKKPHKYRECNSNIQHVISSI